MRYYAHFPGGGTLKGNLSDPPMIRPSGRRQPSNNLFPSAAFFPPIRVMKVKKKKKSV